MKVRKRHLRDLAQTEVKRAVRVLAIWLLQEAESAFARLSVQHDDEALHDFRVAIRKLRSHVQTYRPWLQESVSRKQERRLRKLAHASNPSRDLEVVIEQLEQLTDLSEMEEQGADFLRKRLDRGLQKTSRELIDRVVRTFPSLHRELLVCFSPYMAAVEADDAAESLLGPVAARLSVSLRADLRNRLDRVVSIEHQSEAHDTRIAGKKLRYLHDGLARNLDECHEAAAEVARFQDSLGALHDLHMLLTTIEREALDADAQDQAALTALRERVRRQRLTQFTEVSEQFLVSRANLLMDLIARAEAALSRVASPTEIARAFLLRRFPRISTAEEQEILQGYLPGSVLHERVRRIETSDGTRYFRGVRAGEGGSSTELEEETSEHVFKQMFALTRGKRVRKRRYVLHENGRKWQINRFLDRKLVIAEVELPGHATPLEIPHWLKPVLDREVTEDQGFTNETLAR